MLGAPIGSGGGGVGAVSFATDNFVATAGQTNFSLSHTPYAGSAAVSWNRQDQEVGVDCVISGSVLTFSPLTSGDLVICRYAYDPTP